MTSLQGNMNIEFLCSTAGVSRAGYYRYFKEKEPDAEEMQLRDLIQKKFIQHKRRHGYRYITNELRAEGLVVNHKRVARLMREDNLLAIRAKLFVKTTDSAHDFDVALNLARYMTLTGVDQLWVADITYIRLGREFVFLAVILDVYSRKVVGWALSRSLKADVAVEALNKAIRARQPAPGLVHHSDRGVQYACSAYTAILKQHAITPSMSRPGNPYDNAFCESFMSTLKREEIGASEYKDIDDLRDHLEEFIEKYYNTYRLHSALGYLTPTAFEQAAKTVADTAPTMKYFKQSKHLTEHDQSSLI